MNSSKEIRKRLGLTIVVSAGITYVLSILVIGLLMNVTTISILTAQVIKLIIFGIIGFAVWNILAKKGQMPEN